MDIAELLRAADRSPPVAAVDVVGEQLADAIGATAVSFLIADYSGRSVVRLGHERDVDDARRQGTETAERVVLRGSLHGRALQGQRMELEQVPQGVQIAAPVTNRGEAIGVLELVLPAPPDEPTRAAIADTARALAYLVVANRRFTDLYEWGQRTVRLSLPAEIQHRLLPASFTCEANEFTVAGWLEPSGSVAGDTFDFALARDTLHLSITDAMGHAVPAAMLATVLVGALRNARRGGASLAEQVARANGDLVAHSSADGFVTGQIARIDLSGGTASIVNAGHVMPLRLRAGRVDAVPLTPDLPFGMFPDATYSLQRLPLQAGDRVLFLTDGMLERKGGDIDLADELIAAAGSHPREVVQRLAEAVIDANGGELKDDATLMCLDWYGGGSQARRPVAPPGD